MERKSKQRRGNEAGQRRPRSRKANWRTIISIHEKSGRLEIIIDPALASVSKGLFRRAVRAAFTIALAIITGCSAASRIRKSLQPPASWTIEKKATGTCTTTGERTRIMTIGLERQDLAAIISRDYVVDHGRDPKEKINVLDVLRGLCPEEDKKVLERLAYELDIRGNWFKRDSCEWQLYHAAY